MRRIALFLMTCPVFLVPAQADEETFVDDESALVVRMPAGWSRDHKREHGRIRFAGSFELAPTQYALFAVETGPADGFSDHTWLNAEEAHARTTLARVATPFETDSDFELGGKPAPFYTVAGEGPGHDVRIRASALVHEGRLYRVCEHSFNGAHTAAGADLDRIWQGISFREGGADAFQDEGYDDSDEESDDDSESEEEGSLDLTPPEDIVGETVEDKVGNFTLVLPAGWEVVHEPQDQPVQLRMVCVRRTANIGDIMQIDVRRMTSTNPETFTIETPADVIDRIAKNGFFEQFYGQGSANLIRPEVTDEAELGGHEKSAGFEFRAITQQEEERIAKAQKLRNRGDKTVEVPEYEPIVVRGRLALLSPNIYMVHGTFRRGIADSEEIIAEFKKVLDSWKFIEEGEKPPPLPVGGEVLKDTTEDPLNAKDRKQTKVYMEQGGRKRYKLELKFVLPAGFVRFEKIEGRNLSLLLAAQDAQNNWVRIRLFNQSWQAMSEKRMEPVSKKAKLEEWASNWESKARGVKLPRKGQKMALGKIRGTGYKKMEGTVEKFRGTFAAVVQDKSGFRTSLEIETRGDGDRVFEAGIKKFLKSLKVKPLK